ncbi:MAG: hypothetical protein MUC29_09025, partial [Pyrinomonadaceae bacterium]|nr:hypothetical protein [Pyrinomonadaceae bacterium]
SDYLNRNNYSFPSHNISPSQSPQMVTNSSSLNFSSPPQNYIENANINYQKNNYPIQNQNSNKIKRDNTHTTNSAVNIITDSKNEVSNENAAIIPKTLAEENQEKVYNPTPMLSSSPTPIQSPNLDTKNKSVDYVSSTPLPTVTPVYNEKNESIEIIVCPISKNLPNKYCPLTVKKKIKAGETPTSICNYHKKKNKVVDFLKNFPNKIP